MSAAYKSTRDGEEEYVNCMPGPATSHETAHPGPATGRENRPARADNSSNFTIKLLSVAACIHTALIVALIGVCVYMFQIQAPNTEATAESKMTTFQTANTTQSEWTTLNSQIASLIAKYSTTHSETASLTAQMTTLEAKMTTLAAAQIKPIGFSVQYPKSTTTTGQISFETVITNEGAIFDLGAGEFVCKQSGFYFFTLSIVKDYNHNRYAQCAIQKNGDDQVFAFTNPGHSGSKGNYAATNSIYIHLATGDKVTVGHCTSLSSLYSLSSFTGFLVKADTV